MQQSKAADAIQGTLDPAVRASVRRRVAAMEREFDYLRESRHEDLRFALDKGWTDAKFSVLFVLNSVYQFCIGPLHSSARTSGSIGGDVPIRHGSDTYGSARAREVNQMVVDYESLTRELGIDPALLQKNTCRDLIYWVARAEREEDSGPFSEY